MNYFEARRAERLFREYRKLALEYWNARPPDERDFFDTLSEKAPESLESVRLREQINLLYPEVNDLAMNLGVSVVFQSYPAPAIGGPVLPVNVLLSVVDQEMGHKPIETQMILDMIDRCIGTAKVVKRRSLKRLLIPWYWLIDVPTIIVRFPFLILRNAGLPATVEENIVSQVIKAILVIVILAIGAYFGIQIGVSDLLKLFGK